MILKYEITVNKSLYKVKYITGKKATVNYLNKVYNTGLKHFKKYSDNVSRGSSYYLGSSDPYKVYFEFKNKDGKTVKHTYELIEKG